MRKALKFPRWPHNITLRSAAHGHALLSGRDKLEFATSKDPCLLGRSAVKEEPPVQAADPSARDRTLIHRGLRSCLVRTRSVRTSPGAGLTCCGLPPATIDLCWTDCSQPLPRCVLNPACVCNLHWFRTIKSALPFFVTLAAESYHNCFSIHPICRFSTSTAQEQP